MAKVHGDLYVAPSAGIGMMKGCTQYLFRKEFIELHPEFAPAEHREFLTENAKNLADELNKLYDEASLAEMEALRLNGRIAKESDEKAKNRMTSELIDINKAKEAANSKAEIIEEELAKLAGTEVVLKNDGITIARSLQLKGALKLSRSVRLGARPDST